jgi:hypothetical protein
MYYQVLLPEILHCARRVFSRVCYEFYNKQRFFPCSVNWLVFIMKTGCVYCAVGTKSFDIMQVKFLLQCLKCLFPFTPGLPVGFWFRITVFFPCVLHVPTVAPSLIWNFVISIQILKALLYFFFCSYKHSLLCSNILLSTLFSKLILFTFRVRDQLSGIVVGVTLQFYIF